MVHIAPDGHPAASPLWEECSGGSGGWLRSRVESLQRRGMPGHSNLLPSPPKWAFSFLNAPLLSARLPSGYWRFREKPREAGDPLRDQRLPLALPAGSALPAEWGVGGWRFSPGEGRTPRAARERRHGRRIDESGASFPIGASLPLRFYPDAIMEGIGASRRSSGASRAARKSRAFREKRCFSSITPWMGGATRDAMGGGTGGVIK
jgi:hypothetical protein